MRQQLAGRDGGEDMEQRQRHLGPTRVKSRTRYFTLALVSALAAAAPLAQRGGGLTNAGALVGPSHDFISYACIG
jgi:hypothetical protein